MDKPGENAAENNEVVNRHGLLLASVMTDPDYFAQTIEVAKGIFETLNTSGEDKRISVSEYKKGNTPTPENVEKTKAFKNRLLDLMAEFGYDDSNLLVGIADVLNTEYKNTNDILESNIIREHNIASRNELSKKQLHRDYIVLRALLFKVGAILGFPIAKDDLPVKQGNFSDDLPIVQAEAAFYSHAYMVREVSVQRDPEQGNVTAYKIERSRTFDQGSYPYAMCQFLTGSASLIVREGISSFVDLLNESFKIDLASFGADYDSREIGDGETGFKWIREQDSEDGSFIELHIIPGNLKKGI